MSMISHDVIGDGYTSTFGWDILEDLVVIDNRMAAHTGEREASRIIKEAFKQVGLDEIRCEEFDVPRWSRGSSSLSLPEYDLYYEDPHHVIGLPGSAKAEIEAKIVDGGYGSSGEIDGEMDNKVGLFQNGAPPGYDKWYQEGGTYERATDAGAAGYILYNTSEGCLPTTSAVNRTDGSVPVPAIGVSKEVGKTLLRYAEDDNLKVRIKVECYHDEARSVNTQATVGPDTDEEVLVTAHIDAHDLGDGAADNGIGSAMLPEIGRLLLQSEEKLGTKVRLIAFGAEEIGTKGSKHWVESHDLEQVKCVVNIDGVWGSQNPVINRAIFESLEAPFERTSDRLDVPLNLVSKGPLADALPFAKQGVPAALIGTESGDSFRGWSHTHADTLDKLDPRNMRAITVFLTQAVLDLAHRDTEVSRKEEGALTSNSDE